MIVLNPLSLYTTYLGWQQYELIFQALMQTGIVYLGFLSLAYRFLKEMLLVNPDSADKVLNYFLIELSIVFLICAFFVFPTVPLEQKGLSFKSICTANTEITKNSTLKNTGTTYDEVFADVLSEHIKIPIGFSILQNFISSFTYSTMKVSGCMDSLKAIDADLFSIYLPSKLKQQAITFHHDCFIEARSMYFNSTFDEPTKKKLDLIQKRHSGEEDLKWLGSQTFKTYYYDKLKAKKPVLGFPYAKYPNPNLESEAKKDSRIQKNLPQDGYPTCNQWWLQLRKDLVSLSTQSEFLDPHLGQFNLLNRVALYRAKHQISWRSDITAEDYIAKMLLKDNKDLQRNNQQLLMRAHAESSYLASSLVTLNQHFKSFTSTPLKREAIIQSLPIIQAFFYFFLIILTPLILCLSGYRPKALISLLVLYFVTIFVQCLWHYVGWLDKAIADVLSESDALVWMRNAAVLLYGLAPYLLFKLASNLGGQGGEIFGSFISEVNNEAKSSSQQSASMVKQSVSLATSRTPLGLIGKK